MKLCEKCGSPEHPEWKAHVFVNTPKTSVNTLKALVNTKSAPVNTNVKVVRLTGGDRHREGYMRQYMALRRAVKAGRACLLKV